MESNENEGGEEECGRKWMKREEMKWKGLECFCKDECRRRRRRSRRKIRGKSRRMEMRRRGSGR